MEGNREPEYGGKPGAEIGVKPGGEKDKLSASPWRASQGRQEFSKMGLFFDKLSASPVTRLAGAKTIFKNGPFFEPRRSSGVCGGRNAPHWGVRVAEPPAKDSTTGSYR